jgi:serine/threonine protein kinase
MTAAQWQRVRALFEAALDRAPEDARAWIEREAADDPEVAAEAASLLAHHANVGAFLAEPIGERAGNLLRDEAGFDSGATVGPYSIVREIGRGGMGRVYLATDSRLGRVVALKALPPALTHDPSQRERLRREARAAAALTHPGICTVYALEEIDGDLFIASEFIDGRSLRAEITDRIAPSATEFQRTALELTAALASAHDHGVVHRDLKPENIMRTRDGRLKILDFGLALVASPLEPVQEPRITRAGALLGTPAYMAPEQLRGSQADPRSDVFALGVLLYEYATGVHPFDAPTPVGLAARILEGHPAPLADVRTDLAAPLASIIDRCLEKAPADRFVSAVGLREALTATERVGLRAGSLHVWWRRHQLMVIALYLVACALAWWIKELVGGAPRELFLLIGVSATVAGVFRGHLVFAERMNRASFDSERRRSTPITLAADLVTALALAVDGALIADNRQVLGLVAVALAVGIALTRLVVERATTRGAFGEP